MKTAYLCIVLCIIASGVFITCMPTEEMHPMDCYAVTLIVDSNTGDVIKVTGSQEFFTDPLTIDAWISSDGAVDRDTVNHVVFIEFRQCIEPDRKLNAQEK